MTDSSLTQVNEHYLGRVMDLSQEKEVEASEDIYAANGMKLVSKGARLSHEMQERLILHRLTKPLESTIAVNDGVDMKVVLASGQRLVDEVKPLQLLVGAADNSALKLLGKLSFHHSLLMLLSVASHGGKTALDHAVAASLVAASLARKLGLDEDKVHTVATAGLFHDVGKLYIHPEYLRHERRLKPWEWRHVVSHPVIAQKVLAEVGGLSKAVGQAVLEHHERYNGHGYPQQLAGKAVSIEGQVLAVAEIAASMHGRQELSLPRAELALRIVPGEHALSIVSTLSRVVSEARSQQAEPAAPPAEALARERNALLKRLHGLVELCADLCASPALRSAPAAALLRQALTRLHLIQQALSSTGVDTCAENQDLVLEAVQSKDGFEIHVVVLEINWRISELARDVSLHSESLTEAERNALEPFVRLLEGDEAAKA